MQSSKVSEAPFTLLVEDLMVCSKMHQFLITSVVQIGPDEMLEGVRLKYLVNFVHRFHVEISLTTYQNRRLHLYCQPSEFPALCFKK